MTEIPLYAVVIRPPDRAELLYRVFLEREPCERYLKVCQQATAPEYFRMIEFGLDREEIPA